MQRIIPLAKRAAPLIRLASEYTVANVVNRLLAATSALLLVRLLPVNEYGFYTLAMSAFTFVCTFSDLGATESLSFFRRRAAKRNKSWMPYFYAVLRFRRTIFLFAFPMSAAFIFFTAHQIGEAPHSILTAVGLYGIAAWFAVKSGIISYALKLTQRFRQAYAVELSNETVKLLGVAVIWLTGITTAFAGVATVALGALLAALLATALHSRSPESDALVRPHTRSRMTAALLGQIGPVVPGALHFSLQGPIVAGLAAYFGSVSNVAEVGALGRLGVLIGLVAGFTGTVFVPRLIAIRDDATFLRRYLHWWIVIALLGGSITLIVATFPEVLLRILGENYSGLHVELVIAAFTAVLGSWASYAWAVNRARGWIKLQPYSVPLIVIGQALMIATLDFSSTAGALLLGLGTSLLGLAFQLFINVNGFLIKSDGLHPNKHGQHQNV